MRRDTKSRTVQNNAKLGSILTSYTNEMKKILVIIIANLITTLCPLTMESSAIFKCAISHASCTY